MKFPILPLVLAALTFGVVACDDDDPAVIANELGALELEFDNVFGDGAEQRQLSLSDVGDTNFGYTNAMGQDFNLTFLRYFISDITLHSSSSDDYTVPMEAGVDASYGYYLIKEEDPASQLVRLLDVPAGDYDAVSFTVGIDSNGVLEGATGGILDPVVNKMFWSWNAGYVAIKLEGQSPASPGGAFGNTIDTSVTNGFAYHVGGWKEGPAASPLAYNNRRVRIDFFDNAKVTSTDVPHAHLEFDVARMLSATTMIDFSLNNSVHSPKDSKALGLPDNMAEAFRFDHLHQ